VRNLHNLFSQLLNFDAFKHLSFKTFPNKLSILRYVLINTKVKLFYYILCFSKNVTIKFLYLSVVVSLMLYVNKIFTYEKKKMINIFISKTMQKIYAQCCALFTPIKNENYMQFVIVMTRKHFKLFVICVTVLHFCSAKQNKRNSWTIN